MIMSETTNWKETEMELIETDLPELPRRGERFKYFGTVPSQRAKDAPTPVWLGSPAPCITGNGELDENCRAVVVPGGRLQQTAC
jgi:hypothetical protein